MMTAGSHALALRRQYWTVEVNRSELSESRILTETGQQLAQGELSIDIDRLAISANNITYALLGDSFGYWNRFPSTRPWGRIPAWGYGHVTGSLNVDVPAGTRLYGLFPMASHVIIRAQASGSAIVDTSEHLSSIDPVYNRYVIDGTSSESEMNSYALLRPLIVMSFVLAQYLREQCFFGASTVVITSASSKTALGLGLLLSSEVGTVGVTSPGNLGFVAASQCFTRTATYNDDLGDVMAGDCLILDFAGDDRLIQRLRSSAGGVCKVLRTGQTHPRAAGGAEISRQASDTFFAPEHIKRLTRTWGHSSFDEKLRSAIAKFQVASRPWYRETILIGPDALAEAVTSLVNGLADPSLLTIARPNG